MKGLVLAGLLMSSPTVYALDSAREAHQKAGQVNIEKQGAIFDTLFKTAQDSIQKAVDGGRFETEVLCSKASMDVVKRMQRALEAKGYQTDGYLSVHGVSLWITWK